MRRTACGLVAVALCFTPTGVARAQAPGPTSIREPISWVWNRRVTDLAAAVVTADDTRLIGYCRQAGLFCHDVPSGRLLWKRRLPAVTALRASRGGALLVAFSRREPYRREVYFFDRTGECFHTLAPSEPAEDACVSPDGLRAAVAAGENLILCRRTPQGMSTRVVQLAERPGTVRWGPGDTVYVFSASGRSLQLLRESGKVVWSRHFADASAAFAAAEDGRHVAVVLEKVDGELELMVLTSANELLWRDTRAGRRPRPLIAASGRVVHLGFDQGVVHQGRRRYERRLAFHAPDARWEVGGSLAALLPVAVDAAGEWIVGLNPTVRGGYRLLLLGAGRERRWVYEGEGILRSVTASGSGRTIAAYDRAGILTVLAVASGNRTAREADR